jgi:phosphatidylinositol-3-phosphatase
MFVTRLLQLSRLLSSRKWDYVSRTMMGLNMKIEKQHETTMRTKLHINWSNNNNHTNNAAGFSGYLLGKLRRRTALLAGVATGVLFAAQTSPAHPAQAIGDVFVIAMENHNFTQPPTQTSPQQIFGNPAAPFINSLITPGDPNAAQVSFGTAYYNAGAGVHPSEPNYVWAEAGTDFGAHTDADPSFATGNIYGVPHLTAQLNAAEISWKNYQEDVRFAPSPLHSASGTNGPVNQFNGSTQYNYAVKHNPMAFFVDTLVQNVYPLAQLFDDLNRNSVGRYNWITPDQYNDAHTSLNGGFTYHGTHYTGDSANIAQGDNFLAQVVPQIMASQAYRNNGVIIIWWDETEGGDDTSRTLMEAIISPLAKGNAYASSVVMSHSSDLKTMEEIFGLPNVNNPIPAGETNNFGGDNNVAIVNDLSDLFVPGTIPAASLSVTRGDFVFNPRTHQYSQRVRITNNGDGPAPTPVRIVLDNLSANATQLNADGTTAVLAPLGSPYIGIDHGNSTIHPHETRTVTLEFDDPSGQSINYDTRTLSVVPTP